uniref:Putative n-acetylglucosaminyltransfer n=1 Tax=Amblyomma triste TaxID=251400 RepID=A0A023GJ02_AMBTT
MVVPEQIWKKVLYHNQSVPDNYVDQSFLGQLRKNVNLVHFSLSEALYGVTGVVQQICRTALFAVLFGHLQDGQLHPSCVFLGLTMLGWPTYLLYAFVQQRTTAEVVEDLRQAAIFVAFGSSLAPIMGTLTETISTDTVYAMAAGALLLHVACHDYSPCPGCGSALMDTQGGCTTEAEEPPSDDGPWAAISLNGALFGAVCLASRLPGTGPVLALSSLAVALFH